MRIALLGATGRTGGEFMNQALAAGHHVVAYVHRHAAGDRGREGDGSVPGRRAIGPGVGETLANTRYPLPFRLQHLSCRQLRGPRGGGVVSRGQRTELDHHASRSATGYRMPSTVRADVGVIVSMLDAPATFGRRLLITSVPGEKNRSCGWCSTRVLQAIPVIRNGRTPLARDVSKFW